MPNHTNNKKSNHPDQSKINLSPTEDEGFHCKDRNTPTVKYWFNKQNRKAIGIFDAQNKEILQNLLQDKEHKLQVEIVDIENESFDRIAGQLGRLTQGASDYKAGFVLCRKVSPEPIEMEESKQFKYLLDEFNQKTKNIVYNHGGEWLSSSDDYLLVYFDYLEDALNCSMELCRVFDDCRQKVHSCKVSMNIGMSLNDSESRSSQPSKRSVTVARRLSYINNNLIMLSCFLKDHYQAVAQEFGDNCRVRLLTYSEEKFLNKLMDCLELKWQDENFQVEDIGRQLNCSKSKIYRQMMNLIGQSPNHFIREYRLNRSIDLIRSRRSNISEIAFEAGFGSPSYFSHCFQKRFGLNPSDFMQLMES